MTIEQIIKEAHKLYAGDTSYPDVSSDDWAFMVAAANEAISNWERENNIFWKELFTTYSATTSDGVSQYNLPSNFKQSDGYLRLYVNGTSAKPTLYQQVKPEEGKTIQTSGGNNQIFWITDKINIYPTPTTAQGTANKTFELDYYKKATTYSTGQETTPPEMSDPYYIVDWIVFKLFSNDGPVSADKSSLYFQLANNRLAAMRVAEETPGFFQPAGTINLLSYGFGV
jgi:hypothetical protein